MSALFTHMITELKEALRVFRLPIRPLNEMVVTYNLILLYNTLRCLSIWNITQSALQYTILQNILFFSCIV